MKSRNVPYNNRLLAYTGSFEYNHEGNSIAFAVKYGECLDFLNYNEGVVDRSKSVFNRLPKYSIRNGSDNSISSPYSKENETGYIDVTSTKEHLYGLYSGRSLNGHGEYCFFAQIVHVYNWKGELKEKILVDSDMSLIEIYNSEFIVGISLNKFSPELCVLKY